MLTDSPPRQKIDERLLASFARASVDEDSAKAEAEERSK
jgi:hypothetical protein